MLIFYCIFIFDIHFQYTLIIWKYVNMQAEHLVTSQFQLLSADYKSLHFKAKTVCFTSQINKEYKFCRKVRLLTIFAGT